MTVSDLDPRLVAEQPGLAGAWASFRRRLRQGELGTLPVIVGIAVIWSVRLVRLTELRKRSS